ncbi:MAG: N-acetylglucosamine-6-phosphate deacetylase [Gemmataceae bacterium]|nr:N-acetylglucosamine-6-phosphate deacetylase [Gemmataceae bacterium]
MHLARHDAADAPPGRWAAPSFFDPQVNGGLGVNFTSPDLTTKQVRTVADECRRHGVGGFLPTVITAAPEVIEAALAALVRAREAAPDLARMIPGFHLEGPFLAPDDGPRGAHPRPHVRDPDWDLFRRWQDAAGGLVRLVTLAPERPGALPLIEKLTESGVVVGLGHTAADGDTIRAAVKAGARVSTHLGNGCHAVLPRHPNVLWDQLAEDGLWMSIIPDGHHLPASAVKTFVRAKGVGRTLLTCDAGPLAGCRPGRYREWGADLEVLPGGKVVVAGTPYLAGGGHFTDTCVAEVVRAAGVTPAEAVEMAAVRPRDLLGLPVPADDPVVFDWDPGGEVRVVAGPGSIG